jgi:hypothetical protein
VALSDGYAANGQVTGRWVYNILLDLTREALRNVWSQMKDALGIEQRLIGPEVVDSNLLKETMGKIAVLCDDGKLRYPARVSYDMGWQNAKRMYRPRLVTTNPLARMHPPGGP